MLETQLVSCWRWTQHRRKHEVMGKDSSCGKHECCSRKVKPEQLSTQATDPPAAAAFMIHRTRAKWTKRERHKEVYIQSDRLQEHAHSFLKASGFVFCGTRHAGHAMRDTPPFRHVPMWVSYVHWILQSIPRSTKLCVMTHPLAMLNKSKHPTATIHLHLVSTRFCVNCARSRKGETNKKVWGMLVWFVWFKWFHQEWDHWITPGRAWTALKHQPAMETWYSRYTSHGGEGPGCSATSSVAAGSNVCHPAPGLVQKTHRNE